MANPATDFTKPPKVAPFWDGARTIWRATTWTASGSSSKTHASEHEAWAWVQRKKTA